MPQITVNDIMIAWKIREGLPEFYVVGIVKSVTDTQIRLKPHPKQPQGWFPSLGPRTACIGPIREDQVDAAIEAAAEYSKQLDICKSVFENRKRHLADAFAAQFRPAA